MISISQESFRSCTIYKATGTRKDVSLWLSIMTQRANAIGTMTKLGNNQAKAQVEVIK